MIDLEKITTNGKALFLAYDQGLEHGPTDFNDESVDPENILKIGVDGGFNAIIFQKGVAEKYYTESRYQSKIPLILKLNGKTSFVKDQEPFSPLLCTPEEAKRLGAIAVGYTIYVGSQRESEMFEEFGRVVRSARKENLLVMAWMYPRGKNVADPTNPEVIEYAARIGLELGADIIKIHYPGSLDTLQNVVQAAGRTRVVVSGGKKESEEEFLQLARTVMQSGAIGMAVGRNIWQHKKPLEISKKIKDIIFAKV